ncbi:unnamed protein product [Heligmosomoides polygyrus]|uniref:Complex III subunit 9 n=1 Tax=Heligmosomoides polygyrus TaxID=6339 RepID=A0A183G2B0_HELPZ|nr:unnamed protein product [Heligmosomoides polygyrus]
MSVGSLVYQNIKRWFSSLVLAATVRAFAIKYTFDANTDTYWDNINAGKQCKHIKAKMNEQRVVNTLTTI